MIIVKLSGGLGNQMFQYAAGRRLAFRHNVPLKLDLGGFDATAAGETPRHYALNVFTIAAELAQPEEVAQLCKANDHSTVKVLKFLSKKLLSLGVQTCFKERHFHFDPDSLLLGSNVYLDGYWQSEKYFSDVLDVIIHDFKVRTALAGINLDISRRITATNSVSLHVRRGDYVTDLTTGYFHGLCSLKYYQQAVQYISDKTGSPHLFIFSDDIDWVRKEMLFPCPMTFVHHNGPVLAYEDMRLMSLCKHNIIANSSFSWWGAWLNRNPEKLVVAPAQWFNQQDISTKDLIPSCWYRI